MKPETARKHFTDPFRYWPLVTNNSVQKLKVLPVALLVSWSKVYSWRTSIVEFSSQMQRQILVASNQQNKRYYFAFRRVFLILILIFYFYFSIANTLSGLTLPQLNCFTNEFLVFGSGFLFD